MIGFIGIFLPLIPTVPLVLFSTIAFAKSSQFLHNWLLNHKFFGLSLKIGNTTGRSLLEL
ncbi:DUF454 family protein [Desulfosporosinus shakirovi]|uniref:DUF454 family protein n=1 Tax=Desulfosporosinus shakirovi TaxID=2885154 RepID=UPI0037BF93B2|nr:YbaN family protein [Desulfosporosinus sp. SRJS8]